MTTDSDLGMDVTQARPEPASSVLRRHLAQHHYASSPPQAGMNEKLLLQVLRAVHDTAPKQGSHPITVIGRPLYVTGHDENGNP